MDFRDFSISILKKKEGRASNDWHIKRDGVRAGRGGTRVFIKPSAPSMALSLEFHWSRFFLFLYYTATATSYITKSRDAAIFIEYNDRCARMEKTRLDAL